MTSKYPLRGLFDVISEKGDWIKQRIPLYKSSIEFYYGINYVELEKKKWLDKKIGGIK